jgi:hypothetical protein
MQKYIGTKMICSTPMTRLEWCRYRGWTLPADENGADEGYFVEYLDGGAPNHPDHAGYISWSPKDVHDQAYRPVDGMSFGLAIEALKLGRRVARAGWNGKGMWITHVKMASWSIDPLVNGTGDVSLNASPWIGMRTADECFVPWLASQTDMLADDWQML